jgi:hypothetical protein
MVKDTDQLPPMIREYVTALDAWNLKAAQWLGLDSESVFDLGITQEPTRVWGSWQAIDKQVARVGDRGSLPTYSDGRAIHNGSFALAGADAEAFTLAVGPKPDLVPTA